MTREIPISKIDYGTNVRSEHDEDIMELAKSIEEHDVLQPLVVRPKGNRYEIICGHRRYKALKLVGGDIPVPCIVRDDISDSDVVKVQLEENIQRKNMSALELVDAFEKMKAAHKGRTKLTNEAIAKYLNKTVTWVNNQYFAVRRLDELYGSDRESPERKKAEKYAAGKIITDYQNKKREKTKIEKSNFTVEYLGTTIKIKCDTEAAREKILSELKENFI